MMRHGLRFILSLPRDSDTYIVRNLWIVNTQVITASVWLLFELIFSRGSRNQLFDRIEIRDLARRSATFLEVCRHKNRIATRGIALIENLLQIDDALEKGEREYFSLVDIISLVESMNDAPKDTDVRTSSSNDIPADLSVVDWFSNDMATFDGILDFIGDPAYYE